MKFTYVSGMNWLVSFMTYDGVLFTPMARRADPDNKSRFKKLPRHLSA